MSWWRTTARDFVGASLCNQIRRPEQGLKCTRVGPPTLQNTVCQCALSEVHIVYVCDFQFIPPTRLGPSDFIEHSRIIEVDPRYGVIRFWLLRFFFNAQDPTVRDFRAAETFWIWNLFQKNVRTSRLIVKGTRGFDHVVLN